MQKIILATGSPYRKETFGFLGLDFAAESSDIDESFAGRPDDPRELVRTLARMKAEAVARNHDDGIIIGFDSVGHFNGGILEKPGSRDEAFQRLRSMSGKSHDFYTGIHMINKSTGQVMAEVVMTRAVMRDYGEDEINRYLDQDGRYNTYALGYDPFGHYSTTFIKGIEGSYNNIIRGIPVEVIMKMLLRIGYKI